LNSARQAVVTGIDTFSLGKEIKKKIKIIRNKLAHYES